MPGLPTSFKQWEKGATKGVMQDPLLFRVDGFLRVVYGLV